MKAMAGNPFVKSILWAAAIVLVSLIGTVRTAVAQVSQETLDSLSAPDKIETSIGTLEFKDGAPSADTARKVYDTLDFTRALNVYNNSFRGASALALKKGFEAVGAGSGDIVIFEKLMDANSLFLTANADTVYYLGWIDLSKGPVVIDQPSGGLGAINDMWFQWVIDIGKPGPDRGLGGKYLIVGPDYDGPLPTGGYFVAHAKTNTCSTRSAPLSRTATIRSPRSRTSRTISRSTPTRPVASARPSPRR